MLRGRRERVGASRDHPGLRRGDRRGGHLAALEGVFVATMLFTSVALYVTLDVGSPRPSISPVRGVVEDRVSDLLHALKDIPTSEWYATQLDKAIARGVQGNDTFLDRLVSRTMPPGAECRLFVDNGEVRRLVSAPSERMARESVSKSQLWRPAWAYTFALPSFDLVHSQQPLQVQAYQVSQGALVKEWGVPVRFQMAAASGLYDRAGITGLADAPAASLLLRNETGVPGFTFREGLLTPEVQPRWTSSAPGPLPTPQTFTVPAGWDALDLTAAVGGAVVAYTLTFTSPLGVPFPLVAAAPGKYVLSVPAPQAGTWTFTGAGTITGLPGNPASATAWANVTRTTDTRNYTVVVREASGTPLPAGTLLNLTLPDVFQDLALTPTNQSGWTAVAWGETVGEQNWVSAALASPLANGERNFTFQGRRPPNGNAMYGIAATLDQGAAARATFVVGGSSGVATMQNPLDRELYVSVPKPMAPGKNATWGAVYAFPAAAPGLPDTAYQLDVTSADGSPLFAAVQGLSPPGAWTLLSPAHLRWTGSFPVAANTALGFAFNVTAVDRKVQDEPAIAVPLVFPAPGGTANFTMRDWERPYVHQLSVPPPTDVLLQPQAGYQVPAGAGPAAWGQGSFNVTSMQRGALVRGTAQYNVTAWGTLGSMEEALRLGLARSHLNLSRDAARIGEAVNVTVDFQALYDQVLALGPAVTSWSVDLSIYDPAQPFVAYAEMKPSSRGRFGANATLDLFLDPPPASTAAAGWDPLNETGAKRWDVSSRARANVTFAPPAGAFYGPHAVVAQARFVLDDLGGTQMAQTARLLGVIDVLPDSGQSGTALYWATLECWLADW